MNIVTEKDIIKTYPPRQQKFANQYICVMKLSSLGMKVGEIKNRLKNIHYDTIYCWVYKKGTPCAIRAVEKLKYKKLLPFNLNNFERTKWVAGICGFLFGDGNIAKKFEYLCFTTGNNKKGVKDLKTINHGFYKHFSKQGTIRKQKAEFSEFSYQLRINSVPYARLFYCLGVPKGNKTKIKFNFPKWIYRHDELLREFLRGLLWAEIKTPKLQGKNRYVDSITFTMFKHKHIRSHIKFLNEIRDALHEFGIQTMDIFSGKLSGSFKYEFHWSVTSSLTNRNCLSTTSLQFVIPPVYDRWLLRFRLKSDHLNCLKLAKELPPLYSTKKKERFGKTIKSICRTNGIKTYKQLLESEKEKINKYDKVMRLRKESGWGKRKITKKLEVDQSSVSRWIYYNMKPLYFENLRQRLA